MCTDRLKQYASARLPQEERSQEASVWQRHLQRAHALGQETHWGENFVKPFLRSHEFEQVSYKFKFPPISVTAVFESPIPRHPTVFEGKQELLRSSNSGSYIFWPPFFKLITNFAMLEFNASPLLRRKFRSSTQTSLRTWTPPTRRQRFKPQNTKEKAPKITTDPRILLCVSQHSSSLPKLAASSRVR